LSALRRYDSNSKDFSLPEFWGFGLIAFFRYAVRPARRISSRALLAVIIAWRFYLPCYFDRQDGKWISAIFNSN
jgi:hypothetical protein